MDIAALSARAVAVNRLYVEAFGVERDGLFLLGKLSEEAGEVAGAYLKLHGRARGSDAAPEALRADLAAEMADLLGFLLCLAAEEGVDLATAFEEKWGRYLEAP